MSQKADCILLIVDDSQEDRNVVIDYIKSSESDTRYYVLEAEDLHTGLTLCDQIVIDCALVNYRLPDGSGRDFLRCLLGKREGRKVAVVFMTGMSTEDVAVSAMREGAVDYVNKANMNSEVLMSALAHACCVAKSSR